MMLRCSSELRWGRRIELTVPSQDDPVILTTVSRSRQEEGLGEWWELEVGGKRGEQEKVANSP